jgi:malate dehydrogenase (oxaloacetate-decarboxylating)
VQPSEHLKAWKVQDAQKISLLEVVSHAKPSILIGVSTQSGAFTEEIVKIMAKNFPSPLILPLSNPTLLSEARPQDVIEWTDGKALVATGSPFPPVEYQGKLYPSAQCNNVYIFPGVGLACIACRAQRITETMFVAAALELSRHSPILKDPQASLYPSLEDLPGISQKIALAVAKMGREEGVIPPLKDDEMKELIAKNTWNPKYPTYKRAKT